MRIPFRISEHRCKIMALHCSNVARDYLTMLAVAVYCIGLDIIDLNT